MLLAIFGESCTGKTTLAQKVSASLNAKIMTGKDYQRLAKSEAEARKLFERMLQDSISGEDLIFVISETEELQMVPEGAIRVLVTADLEQIKERFAQRMHGQLPPPVANMLERRHGCFDQVPCDFHVDSGKTDTDTLCASICAMRGTL